MKKLTTLIVFLVVFLLNISAVVYAQEPGECRTVYHKEGKIYQIKAAMYNATHIELPNKLMLDPVAGSANLWTVEGNGHHVVVEPNSNQPQGRKSTLTLIDSQNRSYHFKLLRVKSSEAFDTCVIVKINPKFFKGSNLSSYQTPDEIKKIRMSQQIQNLQTMLVEEKKQSGKKIDSLLKKYRSFVYTRYDWENPVTDVYDDGRFTFIRVKPGHRGMMAVTATIDGKKEMIEYGTESDSFYRISGIYQDFNLKYGNSQVRVKRKDNKSNGVY